jgi:hypothetical protein
MIVVISFVQSSSIDSITDLLLVFIYFSVYLNFFILIYDLFIVFIINTVITVCYHFVMAVIFIQFYSLLLLFSGIRAGTKVQCSICRRVFDRRSVFQPKLLLLLYFYTNINFHPGHSLWMKHFKLVLLRF